MDLLNDKRTLAQNRIRHVEVQLYFGGFRHGGLHNQVRHFNIQTKTWPRAGLSMWWKFQKGKNFVSTHRVEGGILWESPRGPNGNIVQKALTQIWQKIWANPFSWIFKPMVSTCITELVKNLKWRSQSNCREPRKSQTVLNVNNQSQQSYIEKSRKSQYFQNIESLGLVSVETQV